MRNMDTACPRTDLRTAACNKAIVGPVQDSLTSSSRKKNNIETLKLLVLNKMQMSGIERTDPIRPIQQGARESIWLQRWPR
mmetsp:Transcript_88065/g.179699  ORF Transcript_88065/g.179699 Transcript_88065/m.179699 type:complete len:81 (-) Transcript_88065:1350-1592(-)